MNKHILVPLSDNESIRVESKEKMIAIHTNELPFPYNHIFFSEIGKFIFQAKQMKELNFSNEDLFYVLQNRRFFINLDSLNIENDKDVILCEPEYFSQGILNQFKQYHKQFLNIFNEIIKKYDFSNELINSQYLSPHNIFISKQNFFFQYAEFLDEALIDYFDESINIKCGAWISERLLHLFAHKYFSPVYYPIKVLSKNK